MLLHKQPISDPGFAKGIAEELRLCITEVEWMKPKKKLLTHRLSGFGLTGWTWDQLADQFETKSIRHPSTIYRKFTYVTCSRYSTSAICLFCEK